jgi:hypothetical protein
MDALLLRERKIIICQQRERAEDDHLLNTEDPMSLFLKSESGKEIP